jgi:hypothetical protein
MSNRWSAVNNPAAFDTATIQLYRTAVNLGTPVELVVVTAQGYQTYEQLVAPLRNLSFDDVLHQTLLTEKAWVAYYHNPYLNPQERARLDSEFQRLLQITINSYNLAYYAITRIASIDVSQYFDISKLNIHSQKFSTTVLTDMASVDIYNFLTMSPSFVYAKYVGGDNTYYKVFTGENLNQEPKYESYQDEHDSTNTLNSLYFTLYLDVTGNLTNPTKESFFYGKLDFVTKELTYKVTIDVRQRTTQNRQMAADTLQKAFARIGQLTEPIIVNSIIDFNIYTRSRTFPLENFVLFDYCEFQFYRIFMFPNEVDKMAPYHKKYTLGYTEALENTPGITWTITPRKYDPLISYVFDTGQTEQNIVGDYLKIRISNVVTNIERMQQYITRLMCCYFLEDKNAVRNSYLQVCGDVIAVLEAERRNRRIDKTITTKVTTAQVSINNLNANKANGNPEIARIFQDPYKDVCKSGKVPFAHDSLASAEKTQLAYAPFPRNNPTFWFTCPHRKHRFPNIIKDKNGNFLPCCSEKDMSKPSVPTGKSKQKVSAYLEYYGNLEVIAKQSTKHHKTDQFLDLGSTGSLSAQITSFFGDESLERRGIVRLADKTPDTLIDCVLAAIEDNNYVLLENETDRRNYVSRVRQLLGRHLGFEVCAQECWDFVDFSAYANPETFFDGSLYIRLLEETYGVNIYIFDENGYKPPRHYNYCVRHLRIRPTILVYLNLGPVATRTPTTFPRYELIFNSSTSIFGQSVANQCYQLHQLLYNTVDFRHFSDQNFGDSNVHSKLDYQELWGHSILSQAIDVTGHLTRVTLLVTPTTRVTLAVLAGQPLAVPIDEEIYRCPLELVNIFGSPTAQVLLNDSVEGFWFDYKDVRRSVFAYVDSPVVPNLLQITTVPTLDVKLTSTAINQQYTIFNILKIITRWVFDVSRVAYGDTDTTLQNFINSCHHSNQSSVNYYNFQYLGDILPILNSFGECVQYLTDRKVNMTQNGYLSFNNQGVRDIFVQHIRKYRHATRYVSPLEPNRMLVGIADLRKFDVQRYVTVLKSTNTLNEWLALEQPSDYVITKLEWKLSSLKLPYVYIVNNTSYYLIQNIKAVDNDKEPFGTIARNAGRLAAATICREWKLHRINLGYVTVATENISANIFQVGVSGELEFQSTENSDYNVLMYIEPLTREIRYAAMLSLL